MKRVKNYLIKCGCKSSSTVKKKSCQAKSGIGQYFLEDLAIGNLKLQRGILKIKPKRVLIRNLHDLAKCDIHCFCVSFFVDYARRLSGINNLSESKILTGPISPGIQCLLMKIQ